MAEDRPYTSKLSQTPALTFDDVLLRPQESNIEPDEADTTTRVTRNISLNIPVLSAAMDTVTEAEMAIEMARQGGLGVIHRNMSVEETRTHVQRVKQADDYLIPRGEVVTVAPDLDLDTVDALMERQGVGGAPVVNEQDRVLGIISGTDVRPQLELDSDATVSEAMTNEVITAPVDITPREAIERMYDNKIERLPIVDDDDTLHGLMTMTDLLDRAEHESAVRDDDGCLRVGVAVGPFEEHRAEVADEAGADILFVDCSHAHNRDVIESSRTLSETVDADVVVGNIGTREAAKELIDFADGIKVGIGPGSICTTRIVSGAGMPQITAIAEVADVAHSQDIPVIADGGIRYSGDAAKAVAAGADAVMLGSYFAGTDEAPGRVITVNNKRYKQYRGMGSVGAVQDNGGDGGNRYLKDEDEEFIPEGVEAATPYKGPVSTELKQLVGGIQSGMGYVGASTVERLQRAQFVRVSPAGQQESHPHDVMITDEAPNYTPEE